VLDRIADEVAVAFWDRQAGLTEVDIRIPTGGNARAHRLRTACTDFALDHACYMWAMPDLSPVPTPGKPWLVFRISLRNAQFLEHMPSMAAAEMWMIHHGPKL
jgi:hypothetical protein